MKTIEEIAEQAADAVLVEAGIEREHADEPAFDTLWVEMGEGIGYGEAMRALVRHAIEADRAQRDVPAAGADYRNGFDNEIAAGVYDCLTERETEEAARAAEWVAENENGAFWDDFIGPMLDRIEQEYGR